MKYMGGDSIICVFDDVVTQHTNKTKNVKYIFFLIFILTLYGLLVLKTPHLFFYWPNIYFMVFFGEIRERIFSLVHPKLFFVKINK